MIYNKGIAALALSVASVSVNRSPPYPRAKNLKIMQKVVDILICSILATKGVQTKRFDSIDF